jgi:NADH-quinone oxidoreductase subunit J
MLESAVAWLFAALVLSGGLLASLSRQVLYSIIGLGLALLGLSGLFLYLGSPFVAAMQLLIYVGGITVAIVFAMMLSISMAVQPPPSQGRKVALAGLGALAFFAALAAALRLARFAPLAQPLPESAWSVGALGHLLLNAYNLVFETLSLVLLLAIVGAILIARRERTSP